MFIIVMMLFLGINKQLDLQSLLTAVGRYYAKKEGWYQDRRRFQLAFIAEIIVINIFAMVILIRYMKDTLKENGLAILGFGFLLIFIIIRASSFHHVEVLLMGHINWVLEISGIFLIGYSAFALLKRKTPV